MSTLILRLSRIREDIERLCDINNDLKTEILKLKEELSKQKNKQVDVSQTPNLSNIQQKQYHHSTEIEACISEVRECINLLKSLK
jgi:predicted  nucleic acid-binding Zn-ribbon protein